MEAGVTGSAILRLIRDGKSNSASCSVTTWQDVHAGVAGTVARIPGMPDPRKYGVLFLESRPDIQFVVVNVDNVSVFVIPRFLS